MISIINVKKENSGVRFADITQDNMYFAINSSEYLLNEVYVKHLFADSRDLNASRISDSDRRMFAPDEIVYPVNIKIEWSHQ